jgi:hypothetical protein
VSRQKAALAGLIYRLPLKLRRHAMYFRFTHQLGHFSHPRTFNEKVNWRILHDRRPLLEWTCDKLRMKERAQELGFPVAATLWSGTDLRELADVALPGAWVLKPNHRSRLIHFGSGPFDAAGTLDSAGLATLTAKTTGWLRDEQGAGRGEWAYTRAQHIFLVEERLGSGQPLTDYKLFCYAGEVLFAQVTTDTNRLTGAAARRFYTADWEPLDARQWIGLAPVVPRPAGFDEMCRMAREISAPFDFLRVDLYDLSDVDGTIVFGEVTPYPAGGLGPFRPRSFDRELGEPWVLPQLDADGR